MLKKLLAGCVALIMSTGIVHAEDSALTEIVQSGVLKVGTTGDWNPMTMKDPATNSYTGFDIDVTTALAEDLGVKVEYVPTDWKTLVAGITSGKYHMSGSASISPKRAKVAGYSSSYVEVGQVPLILQKRMRANLRMGMISTSPVLLLQLHLAQHRSSMSNPSSRMRPTALSKPRRGTFRMFLQAVLMDISHPPLRQTNWLKNTLK